MLKAREIENIKIVRYQDSIFYANAESFTNHVLKKIDVDVEQIDSIQSKLSEKKMKKKKSKLPFFGVRSKRNIADVNSIPSSVVHVDIEQNATVSEEKSKQQINDILRQIGFKHLILDCSCVNYVDMMGSNAIIEVKT